MVLNKCVLAVHTPERSAAAAGGTAHRVDVGPHPFDAVRGRPQPHAGSVSPGASPGHAVPERRSGLTRPALRSALRSARTAE